MPIKFEVCSEPSRQYDGEHFYIRGGYYKTRAEAERARKKLENPWIPVSERLPDKGYEVLVVADGYRIIGRRTPHGGWDIPADYRNVTHWMPMPEPPEGNTNVEG